MDEKRLRLEKMNNHHVAELQEFLAQETDNLELADVNLMLEILVQKKQQLEADNKITRFKLLKEFLDKVRKNKQEQLDQLTKEINYIDEDTKRVQDSLSRLSISNQISSSDNDVASFSGNNSQDGFNGSKNSGQTSLQCTLAGRRMRMHTHFDDLQKCYFNLRNDDFGESVPQDADGLELFLDNLAKFTRYNSMRTLATLSYACDLFNGSSIVSSIEFDKDSEFFAIAGTLASSDYEGTVTVWDAFTGQKVKVFQEHEKRCWSVDFNRVDTKLIASGSDDAKVKLWSTNVDNSVASLDAKANVCCVKFSPDSRYHLAFGSADHCVHYYDLRNSKKALGLFKGHLKAVSYVKFLNPNEIVSASTDSELKLWSVGKPSCLRSFTGHTNEKNFVGLATDGDYIVCGSENNSLYVYYKGLSRQLLTMKFDTVRSVLEKDKKEEDANEFVSAVCWRQGSNVVVAANSQGTIKVLELV
ncbi:hypothetical protein CHUAL_006043 [Chamberlinius hualienensis]